jgi:hypothetical protein
MIAFVMVPKLAWMPPAIDALIPMTAIRHLKCFRIHNGMPICSQPLCASAASATCCNRVQVLQDCADNKPTLALNKIADHLGFTEAVVFFLKEVI